MTIIAETIYVQFFDVIETLIVSVFDGIQDPVIWPHQGTVQTSDLRYRNYYESIGALASQWLPAPLD